MRAVVAAGRPRGEVLCLPLCAGEGPGEREVPPAVRRAADRLRAGERFRGEPGEVFWLQVEERLAVLVGLGAAGELTEARVRSAAGEAGRRLRGLGARTVDVVFPPEPPLPLPGVARAFVEGFGLGAYRVPRSGGPSPPPEPALRLHAPRAVRPAVRAGVALVAAVRRTRDLVNRPANHFGPEELVEEARRVARTHGYRLRVHGVRELRRRGCGGLLAVGQGSARGPRLVHLAAPPRRGRPRITLVGKGIVFDAGGLSLKPAAGMEKMKYDMAGAAAVLGILEAAARLRLPVELRAYLGVAENLPSARAYRPGDVLRLADGTTVEVVNTDAEGRLVLADALSLAAREKPDVLLDLATLTGACFVALGSHAVGLMSNADELAEALAAAGAAAGERVWRLPLWPEYRRLIESDVAELKNSGGREAATITAGKFLEHFAGGRPWAHLDIASTAWSDTERGHWPKGATGVGVALVSRYLEERT